MYYRMCWLNTEVNAGTVKFGVWYGDYYHSMMPRCIDGSQWKRDRVELLATMYVVRCFLIFGGTR